MSVTQNVSTVRHSEKQIAKKVPFAVSEAYKSIRTNLTSILEKQKGSIVAFSSPGAAEGKSTTSLNTAISLSQLNRRVLLIDADAHRPSLHVRLRMPNDMGLMSVLTGLNTFDEAVKSYNPYLDVLTAGPLLKNSTEVLSSPEFERFVDETRPKYDYVVFDTPPVNVLSDPLVVAKKCDGLVLVVRSNVTTFDAVRKVIDSAEMLNINILGVIINGTELSRKGYYNGYYKGR